MHLQKGAQEVHNQKVRASFINIIVEAMLNYQIAYCATTKVLSMLLCYRTNNTEHNNKQSFSQTSLNSNIIRLLEYKLKNTVLKLIKS